MLTQTFQDPVLSKNCCTLLIPKTLARSPLAGMRGDDDRLEDEASTLIQEHGAQALLDDMSAAYPELVSTELLPFVAQLLLGAEGVARPLSLLLEASDSRLSTGVQSIDTILGGGLPLTPGGMLVEIHGAAASGKTQLCLQICAGGAGSIYAVTAGVFPVSRFTQIAPKTAQRATTIELVRDVRALEDWAANRLPWLLRTTRARVVIVDSIAALYRPAFARGSEIERARSLAATAAALKSAAAAARAVVICVNQVSSQPGRPAPVPALGQAWARCCSTRLEISRTRGRSAVRRVRVLHSSFRPSGAVAYFTIGPGGLSSADEDD